jgi:hypothetical protein
MIIREEAGIKTNHHPQKQRILHLINSHLLKKLHQGLSLLISILHISTNK